MRERLVSRSIIGAGIVMLAAASLPQTRFEYARDISFPELIVHLQLPASANVDSANTTRRWVLPIESALRSAGDLTGSRGEVDGGSANVVARFKQGIDVDLKAARLASELAPLRNRLPRGGSLAIFPSRGGARPAAIFAVTARAAPDAAERIADELRSTPGVRDVFTYGSTPKEIDVRAISDAVALDSDMVLDAISPRPLGDVVERERRIPLITSVPADLRDIRVGHDLVRLESVATIRQRRAAPDSFARVDGKPAAILAVYRDDDSMLMEFDRTVRRVAGPRVSVIASDADELRLVMKRVLAGLLVATCLLAIGGGPWLGFYVILASAILINVWRIAGVRVDEQTVLASVVALAAITPFAALRRTSRNPSTIVIAIAFAAILPIAATFGTGALAPLLTPAAVDFAIAIACATVAASLVPVRHSNAPGDRPARLTKFLLRNATSVILTSSAIVLFSLTWTGERLDPRRTEGSADRSRVYVRLQMPSGSTLEQTATAVTRIEEVLTRVRGVKRYSTWARPGSALVNVEVERQIEQPQRYEMFANELRSRIPPSAGSITVQASFERASAVTFAESIEEKPFTDKDATRYRFLLKGTDANALRIAADRLEARIVPVEVSRRGFRRGWPDPSPRVELVPRPFIANELADEAASALARASLPAAERHLPDGTIVRASQRDAPRFTDDVPRRADLFARPIQLAQSRSTVDTLFNVRVAATEGTVMRELGRFVLPVDLDIFAYGNERLPKRERVDRTVRFTTLPPGVIAERPNLSEWSFSVEKLRLAAMTVFLPALIFIASAIVLSSSVKPLAALAPPLISIACVAPMLALLSAPMNEMTLLATGGAVVYVAALAVAVLHHAEGAAATYRIVRANAVMVACAVAAAVLMLAISASARPSIGDSWRAPLFASAAAFLGGMPAALFLPSSLLLVTRDVQRRRGKTARAHARPAVWSDPSALPHLTVRNLTKVYARGFRALHRVTFDLQPGVVGLLGPNGAGKTTLLRIVTGLLQQSRGLIAYRGIPVTEENIAEFRRAIGFLPQEFNAYPGLTATQFLDFWALERGIDDAPTRRDQIENLLAAVGLEEHANRRVRDFSGGMRQRIGIARALLGDPPLLVVDEPTTGLDIEARRRFRDLLTAIARRRIVILSSHIASDVETTAKHLLLLARGRLRWEGTVDALLARAEGRVFEMIVSDNDLRALSHEYRVTARVRVAGGIRVRGVITDDQILPGPAARPSLEEAYLSEVSTGVIRKGSFAFVFRS
jgi:ABC-type multidrug transport system ATPase subunit/multidrug efflux pump subunit AcrB